MDAVPFDLETHSDGHDEEHYVNRTGWLRAAVLGANDGVLSTSSVLVGVAAAAVSGSQLLLTGVAAIAAGALSMAAGEYVSVSSQADSEAADLAREKAALARHPEQEKHELTQIYQLRGLPLDLAEKVAHRLTAHDALDAHARDELGITDRSAAKPIQAAVASALSFAIGGLPPLAMVLLAPPTLVLGFIFAAAIVTLIILGAAGAKSGGAPITPGIIRVTLWGTLAMAATAGIGHLFHTSLS
jgi:VIT1/CCC1 family predicted Fe2+/Mn2+ transporter